MWTPPDDIDPECIDLCRALNSLPGVETVGSCCGHDVKAYSIYILCDDLDFLVPVCYYTDGCHCGFYGWKVVARTDCGMSPVWFCLVGPIGPDAYTQSKKIAKLIEQYIAELMKRG